MKFDEEYWEKLDKEIPGWISKEEAEFLVENVLDEGFRLNYVEIGVAFGKSLSLVRHHFPGMWRVAGIDKIDHSVHKIIKNVEIEYGDANEINVDDEAIDTLFIDGDHTYKGCLSDFVHWYNKVAPGGRIIFHDYGRDKAHEGVTKTVDAIKPLLTDHATVRAIWAGTKP